VPLPGAVGGWKKIFKPPKPERGGGPLMLKLSKTFARGNHGEKIARSTDIGPRIGAHLS
jgi:hypothetical protein